MRSRVFPRRALLRPGSHTTRPWRKCVPGTYSFELGCGDPEALTDALSLDRFTLIGHSMGARVGCIFAEKFPERIERMVWEDAAPIDVDFPEGSDEVPGGVPIDFSAATSLVHQIHNPDPSWWNDLPKITAPTLIIGSPAPCRRISSSCCTHPLASLARPSNFCMPWRGGCTVQKAEIQAVPSKETVLTANRITLDLGDIRITGTEVPGRPGMPLLVCLPGGGYNASYFDVAGYSLVDAARREGFPVVSLDRPGHGGSTALNGEISFRRNAQVLQEAIAELWYRHLSNQCRLA